MQSIALEKQRLCVGVHNAKQRGTERNGQKRVMSLVRCCCRYFPLRHRRRCASVVLLFLLQTWDGFDGRMHPTPKRSIRHARIHTHGFTRTQSVQRRQGSQIGPGEGDLFHLVNNGLRVVLVGEQVVVEVQLLQLRQCTLSCCCFVSGVGGREAKHEMAQVV